MGVVSIVDNTGDTECHFIGATIHLPPENVDTANQGASRQRISIVDCRSHVGKQMCVVHLNLV